MTNISGTTFAPFTWGPSIPFSTVAPPRFIRGKADVIKLVTSGVMFAAVIGATLGPAIAVRRYRDRPRGPSRYRRYLKTGISCMNCFAGGVFLATGMLDVLPDAIESIHKGLKAYNLDVDYPIAHLCLLIGFFILLSIEQMVLCCTNRHSHHEPDERTPLFVEPDLESSQTWRTASLTASLEGIQRPPASPEDDVIVSERRRNKIHRRLSTLGPARVTQMGEVSRYDRSVIANSTMNDASEEPHDHFVEMLMSGGSPIRSIFLIGALSVHSIFEGLTLGLEESSVSVYQLVGAICLHKLILAAAIGLSLGQTLNLSFKLLMISSMIFGLASPLGTLVGMVLRFEAAKGGGESINRFQLVSGILEGTACGTFLYVTFFEILPREINDATRPLQRTIYMIHLLVGFTFMSILVNWA